MKYNTGTLLMVLSRPVQAEQSPAAVDKTEKVAVKAAKTPSKGDAKNLNP
jgi:hypothetical protein